MELRAESCLYRALAPPGVGAFSLLRTPYVQHWQALTLILHKNALTIGTRLSRRRSSPVVQQEEPERSVLGAGEAVGGVTLQSSERRPPRLPRIDLGLCPWLHPWGLWVPCLRASRDGGAALGCYPFGG